MSDPSTAPQRAARPAAAPRRVSLPRIAREWTRLGLLGFGGPPAHFVQIRALVVEREGWLDAERYEDAIAAANLIPGPSSTQVAIFSAWAVGGPAGAVVGAAGFILPGFAMVVALATVVLATSPPAWVLGAGAGAGAAVPAVALAAAHQLLGVSVRRAVGTAARARWLLWAVVGAVVGATAGAYVVFALLACGLVELLARGGARRGGTDAAGGGGAGAAAGGAGRGGGDAAAGGAGRGGGDAAAGGAGHGGADAAGGGGAGRGGRLLSIGPLWLPAALATAAGGSALGALAWTGFKVGALSYGGGFVVIPLMHADAVEVHHWLTDPQFLSAVAVGQITPGPINNTVAAVGWSAAGLIGACVAALFTFGPSIAVIALGGQHFEWIRGSDRARAFLAGGGPAALGAILGSTVPLAMGLSETWQWVVLVVASALLLSRRLGLVPVLVGAGVVGVVIAAAGGPVPG
jgi:chromate transporter